MDIEATGTYYETLSKLGNIPLQDITGFVLGVGIKEDKAIIAGGGNAAVAEALLTQLEERVAWEQYNDEDNPVDRATDELRALGYKVFVVNPGDLETSVSEIMDFINSADAPEAAQEGAEPPADPGLTIPTAEALLADTLPVLKNSTLVRMHNEIVRELTARQAVGVPA